LPPTAVRVGQTNGAETSLGAAGTSAWHECRRHADLERLGIDLLQVRVGHSVANVNAEVRNIVQREYRGIGHVWNLDPKEIGVLDIVQDESRPFIGLRGPNVDVLELDALHVANIKSMRWHLVARGRRCAGSTPRSRGRGPIDGYASRLSRGGTPSGASTALPFRDEISIRTTAVAALPLRSGEHVRFGIDVLVFGRLVGGILLRSAPLMQHTNGTIFGTNSTGGSPFPAQGTFFSLNIGASPFISLVTPVPAGKEGTKVGILGQGFSPASVVKFGGVKATTVTQTGKTFLLATVPAGALTGKVTVTTGSTTLSTTSIYKVSPTIKAFSPTSGPVGTPVTITGTGLTQATKVTFNGASTTFAVESDSKITTTVPTGATSGMIAVTTKGGTITSSTIFTVN